MDNKNYIYLPNLSSLTNSRNIDTKTSSIPFVISTPTTSSLNPIQSHKIYSENIVITQPIVKYIKIKR